MEQKTSLNYDEDRECSYQLYLKGTLSGIGRENESIILADFSFIAQDSQVMYAYTETLKCNENTWSLKAMNWSKYARWMVKLRQGENILGEFMFSRRMAIKSAFDDIYLSFARKTDEKIALELNRKTTHSEEQFKEEIFLLEQTYPDDEELDEFSDEEVPPDSAGVVDLTDCDTSPALQPGNFACERVRAVLEQELAEVNSLYVTLLEEHAEGSVRLCCPNSAMVFIDCPLCFRKGDATWLQVQGRGMGETLCRHLNQYHNAELQAPQDESFPSQEPASPPHTPTSAPASPVDSAHSPDSLDPPSPPPCRERKSAMPFRSPICKRPLHTGEKNEEESKVRFAGSDYALFFPRTPAAEVPLRYWSSEEEACQLDKFWQIKSVLRVSLGTYGYMLILQCADWVKVGMSGFPMPLHDPTSTRYGAQQHLASLNLCGVFWDQFVKIIDMYFDQHVGSLEERRLYNHCLKKKLLSYVEKYSEEYPDKKAAYMSICAQFETYYKAEHDKARKALEESKEKTKGKVDKASMHFQTVVNRKALLETTLSYDGLKKLIDRVTKDETAVEHWNVITVTKVQNIIYMYEVNSEHPTEIK